MSTALLEAPERIREGTPVERLDPDALYETIDGIDVELPPKSKMRPS